MKICLEINGETFIIITKTQNPLLGEVCSVFKRLIIMAGYPANSLKTQEDNEDF